MSKDGRENVKILVVDDEAYMREIIRQALEDANFRAEEVSDGNEAIEKIRQHPYDVVITDLRLPGQSGERILQEAIAIFPDSIVIVMTGFGNIQTAVDAIKMGAYDYLPKPFQLSELVLRVEKGLKERELKSENSRLRSQLQGNYQFSSLLGNSAGMKELYNLVAMVAQTSTTVLITGETGTGKELIARAIHYNSPRRDRPLISVHLGAVPANLLEDDLFGHLKGAFTGAHQHRAGYFEQANHSTLFLDEVATMPLDLQVKLLRVLQEREFQRLGGTSTIKVDVRIIAATNVDLLEKVHGGEFREDLYYRLNVIPIQILPLRDRREDIPLLVSHFVKKYCAEQNLPAKQVAQEAIERLTAFDWPGNVRQLENAVEMAVTLSGGREVLRPADFPIVAGSVARDSSITKIEIPADGIDLNHLVADLERRLILQCLQKTAGNRKQAALLLKLKRTTLVEKIKRLGLESEVMD